MSFNLQDFEIFITSDGSPTLKSLKSKTEETMHNKVGAFSETEFIYGRALRKTFSEIKNPQFLSLGLGLGYNEMLIACEALSLGYLGHQEIYIESYESVPELKSLFSEWLTAENPNIYTEVEKFFHLKFKKDFKFFLKELYLKKQLQLLGGLNLQTTSQHKFNCILYDAFSSHTSPELWSEEFLDGFIQKFCASHCVWSTYACTGNLKRALKKNGFQILSTEGFSNKRESTFAAREIIF